VGRREEVHWRVVGGFKNEKNIWRKKTEGLLPEKLSLLPKKCRK